MVSHQLGELCRDLLRRTSESTCHGYLMRRERGPHMRNLWEFSHGFFDEDGAGLAVHAACMEGVCCLFVHMRFVLRRSELPTTDTLENAIANPANAGESIQPRTG